MNDFTKEELKVIRYSIEKMPYKAALDNNKIPDVMHKVIDAIENYCQHDWREGSMGSIYCKNCKHRINFKISGF